MMKSTYGTGCFALAQHRRDMVRSKNRLLTTIAYRLDGETTYALEGSIFIAGAAVQWLRDGLGIIERLRDRAAGARPIRRRRSIWCRPSPASARRIGMPRRAARCSA
jgi:glycerol kinase